MKKPFCFLGVLAFIFAAGFLASCNNDLNATAPDDRILAEERETEGIKVFIEDEEFDFMHSPFFEEMNTNSASSGLITLTASNDGYGNPYEFDTAVLLSALELYKLTTTLDGSVSGTQVLEQGDEVPFTVTRSAVNYTNYEVRFAPPATADIIQLRVKAAFSDKAGRKLDTNGNNIPAEDTVDDYYTIVWGQENMPAGAYKRNPWAPIQITDSNLTIDPPLWNVDVGQWKSDISFSFSMPGGSASASSVAAEKLAQTLLSHVYLQSSDDGNNYDSGMNAPTSNYTKTSNSRTYTASARLTKGKVYRLVFKDMAGVNTGEYKYYGFTQSVKRGTLNAQNEVYGKPVSVPIYTDDETTGIDDYLKDGEIKYSTDSNGRNAVVYVKLVPGAPASFETGDGLGGTINTSTVKVSAAQTTTLWVRNTTTRYGSSIYYYYDGEWINTNNYTLYWQNPDGLGKVYCYRRYDSDTYRYVYYPTYMFDTPESTTVQLIAQNVEAQKDYDNYGDKTDVLKITLAPVIMLFANAGKSPGSDSVSFDSMTIAVSPDVTVTEHNPDAETKHFYDSENTGNAYIPKGWSTGGGELEPEIYE